MFQRKGNQPLRAGIEVGCLGDTSELALRTLATRKALLPQFWKVEVQDQGVGSVDCS